MPYRSLTNVAHELLRPLLKPGDIAVDATAGNGFDAQFLAGCVGPSGVVHAIDVQEAALKSTAVRLTAAGISWAMHRLTASSPLPEDGTESVVRLIQGDHAELEGIVPEGHRGRVAAVAFNLGYLPGGDKLITTAADRTVRAVEAAVGLLRPGGALSILAYRGHEGGADEYAAVERCLRDLTDAIQSTEVIRGSDADDSPILLFSRKR